MGDLSYTIMEAENKERFFAYGLSVLEGNREVKSLGVFMSLTDAKSAAESDFAKRTQKKEMIHD
jgi:hypothetical protein